MPEILDRKGLEKQLRQLRKKSPGQTQRAIGGSLTIERAFELLTQFEGGETLHLMRTYDLPFMDEIRGLRNELTAIMAPESQKAVVEDKPKSPTPEPSREERVFEPMWEDPQWPPDRILKILVRIEKVHPSSSWVDNEEELTPRAQRILNQKNIRIETARMWMRRRSEYDVRIRLEKRSVALQEVDVSTEHSDGFQCAYVLVRRHIDTYSWPGACQQLDELFGLSDNEIVDAWASRWQAEVDVLDDTPNVDQSGRGTRAFGNGFRTALILLRKDLEERFQRHRGDKTLFSDLTSIQSAQLDQWAGKLDDFVVPDLSTDIAETDVSRITSEHALQLLHSKIGQLHAHAIKDNVALRKSLQFMLLAIEARMSVVNPKASLELTLLHRNQPASEKPELGDMVCEEITVVSEYTNEETWTMTTELPTEQPQATTEQPTEEVPPEPIQKEVKPVETHFAEIQEGNPKKRSVVQYVQRRQSPSCSTYDQALIYLEQIAKRHVLGIVKKACNVENAYDEPHSVRRTQDALGNVLRDWNPVRDADLRIFLGNKLTPIAEVAQQEYEQAKVGFYTAERDRFLDSMDKGKQQQFLQWAKRKKNIRHGTFEQVTCLILADLVEHVSQEAQRVHIPDNATIERSDIVEHGLWYLATCLPSFDATRNTDYERFIGHTLFSHMQQYVDEATKPLRTHREDHNHQIGFPDTNANQKRGRRRNYNQRRL